MALRYNPPAVGGMLSDPANYQGLAVCSSPHIRACIACIISIEPFDRGRKLVLRAMTVSCSLAY